jgi:hypothetical protein
MVTKLNWSRPDQLGRPAGGDAVATALPAVVSAEME